ncbi:MAG: M23 family metallopeptidase, partial [Candidatus Pacebacteria bacterium]|nr:M23 family metallopeptidase [Candidatus Paceibacterota bacterium]
TNGLPAGVQATVLYLYAVPSGSANPSQMSIFRIASDWSPSTVGWSTFPSVGNGYAWPVSTTVNAWRAYTITDWYNGWKSGTYSNYGILLWPYNSDGTQRFDRFLSMRSTDQPHRPMLGFTFTPTLSLKMPLPGGYSWLPSTEVGGYDCLGGSSYWPDQYHQGENYFSIDFTSQNVLTTQQGPTPYTSINTPILAAASGKVLVVGTVKDSDNGYHIVLDHDSDGKSDTGFQTRYLHLRDVPKRKNGVALKKDDIVAQGDQIGIMGNTGLYTTGTHLHFGVRYKDKGNLFVNDVAKVVMDGKLLKGYQTECKVNTSGAPQSLRLYYPSANTPTGK